MREILFRAKDMDTKKWRFGQYIHLHKTTHCFKEDNNANNDIHQIVFEEMTDWGLPNRHSRADIDVNTLGQFTGFTDKNGMKIFEGDIFVDREDEVISVVEFRDGMFCLVDYGIRGALMPYGYDESAGGFGECDCQPMDNYYIDQMEIDGNIYDNPELLKGE